MRPVGEAFQVIDAIDGLPGLIALGCPETQVQILLNLSVRKARQDIDGTIKTTGYFFETIATPTDRLLGLALVAEILIAASHQNSIGAGTISRRATRMNKGAKLLDDIAVRLGDTHFVKAVEQQNDASTCQQVQENLRIASFASSPSPVFVQDVA